MIFPEAEKAKPGYRTSNDERRLYEILRSNSNLAEAYNFLVKTEQEDSCNQI